MKDICVKTIDLDVKLNREEVRDKIIEVEARIRLSSVAMGHECFPLKHSFGEGLYIREITVPAGSLVVTKIHKHTHPYFVLKGDISVLTEEGVKMVRAPFSGITPAGTKRICYCHTDTVWTTVHSNINNTRDLDKIEDEVIAKTFDEFDEAQLKGFIEAVAVEDKKQIA